MAFLSRGRVVSLVPSITETLLAWGVTPVAVTRFCEQPRLPTVGGTKDPDVEAIIAMRPDVVVMEREENRVEDHDALRAAGVKVVTLHVDSVAAASSECARLAHVLALPTTVVPPAPPAPAPLGVRAFVPIWRRPSMTISGATYGGSLLDRLGVENVFAGAPSPFPETTLGEAAGRQPDVVLAPSEPYPFGERHRAELEAVAPVVFVDGRDLFWWGARTAAAIGRLHAHLSSVMEAEGISR